MLPASPTGSSWLRRAVWVSLVTHAVIGVIAWRVLPHEHETVEVVDIDLAPPPPAVEALPAEVVRAMEEAARVAAAAEAAKVAAEQVPPPPHEDEAAGTVDAGVDAAARPDAAPRPDATKPDAAVDAMVDAPLVASGSGSGSGSGSDSVAGSGSGSGSGSDSVAESGSGSGSGSGSDAIAAGEAGSGSGSGSAFETNPALAGAATSPGTAANLLAYFPPGHLVTALIRFDRLRGTEWGPLAERVLHPMPDYQVLFGTTDAKIVDKLDTLVISSPAPKDASATTLVARVSMNRAALRTFLNAGNPVAWSPAKGGLLGRRTGRTYQNDHRVFLSPFRGWFVLGQPRDLPGLLAPATGNLDAIEASTPLPPWLQQIRTIEKETGDDKDKAKAKPALVVTLAFDGKPVDLTGQDFGLGLGVVQTPSRVSLAMEIVKQGWIVRGNLKFATEADAASFLATIKSVRQTILDSRLIQLGLGKPVVHLVENLAFAQAGSRLSYATSLSIADARGLLEVAGMQLDSYFTPAPTPTPTPAPAPTTPK